MNIAGSCVAAYLAILAVDGFHFDGSLAWAILLALVGLLTYYVKAEMKGPTAALQVQKETLKAHHESLKELIEEFKEYRHETMAPWLLGMSGQVDKNKWAVERIDEKLQEILTRMDRYEARLERYEQAAMRHHGERP